MWYDLIQVRLTWKQYDITVERQKEVFRDTNGLLTQQPIYGFIEKLESFDPFIDAGDDISQRTNNVHIRIQQRNVHSFFTHKVDLSILYKF